MSQPQPGVASTRVPVEVHGAGWCEDTSRARRLLRRLGVAHRYHDVDEDLAALERATTLNNGVRRTPVITIGDSILVEPDNAALAAAVVDQRLLSREDVQDRLEIQNVGDVERCLRAGAGLSLLAAAGRAPRGWRSAVQLLGGALLVSGTAGWCPLYRSMRVSSLDGPGDRPQEAERTAWLRPAAAAAPSPSPVAPSTVAPPAAAAAVSTAD